MEKIRGFFEDYKGIIIFYIIIGVLAFLLTKKIEDINAQARITTEQESYYA